MDILSISGTQTIRRENPDKLTLPVMPSAVPIVLRPDEVISYSVLCKTLTVDIDASAFIS